MHRCFNKTTLLLDRLLLRYCCAGFVSFFVQALDSKRIDILKF